MIQTSFEPEIDELLCTLMCHNGQCPGRVKNTNCLHFSADKIHSANLWPLSPFLIIEISFYSPEVHTLSAVMFCVVCVRVSVGVWVCICVCGCIFCVCVYVSVCAYTLYNIGDAIIIAACYTATCHLHGCCYRTSRPSCHLLQRQQEKLPATT